jgi:hypothetical protein
MLMMFVALKTKAIQEIKKIYTIKQVGELNRFIGVNIVADRKVI